MGLIQRFLEKQRIKKEERNRKCSELIAQLSYAISEAYGYCTDTSSYVDISLAEEWKSKYYALQSSTSEQIIKTYRKTSEHSTLRAKVNEFLRVTSVLRPMLETHNENVAKRQISETYAVIGNVEGRQLDSQQMLCIVKEAHNHLIIAGAGTGKTTTVVGKIKYLLKSGKCKPEDVLVLSFTNASAAEMSERINKETGCKIAASTFHKLGLCIITQAEGVTPKISQIKLRTFIRDHMKILMENPRYVSALSNYLLYNKVAYKSEFDFKNESEYKEYLQLNPPVTILNEQVKSYGEMDIANFLFQNRIKYEYEAKYKFDTRTENFAQYHPDFYLPEYDVYIEYFGINRNGEVPLWFSGKNGKTATQVYQETIAWKRRLHADHQTKMIEIFSYEKLEGTLLEKLEKSLKIQGVILSPMSSQELWQHVTREGESVLDGITELFETVINLLKSNNYSIDYFRSIAVTSANAKQQLDFIDLLQPIYDAYNEKLASSDEIDFNDMINLATQHVREGRYHNPYTHVIVDEYQDISKSRFMLLSELRKSKDFDLFCVGDDWQSIYRFAGSDISYILNFEKFWGPTTISKIETTYRFTRSLIEISGSFIMQNPEQIKKQIQGKSSDTRFSLGEINGYTEKYAVDFMSAKIDDLPRGSTVYFIGRYSFNVNLLRESGIFECQYNNISGFIDVKYSKRKDLKMCFMTAHKSKGLQADYVFIINNSSSRMGFPSRIQDDPILSLLLDNSENYPFAEERRLYYVALTRAKTKVYLLTVKDHESIFIHEIRSRYLEEIKKEQFECPICGGKLLRKTGPYGDFFGCENYKIMGCTYKRKIRTKS